MVIKLPKSVEGKATTPESVDNSGQTTTDVPEESANTGQGDFYNPYQPTPPVEMPSPENPAPPTSTPEPSPAAPDPGGSDQGGMEQGGTDQGGDSEPQIPEVPVS